MKSLILYYSYGGNTKGVAELLQKELGCDMEEIKTLQTYPDDYDTVVAQGQREVDSGFLPEISPLRADLSQYGQILLGTPVWWYTFAPAVKTLLDRYDFSGKNIYPFITNGGWIGHTAKDIQKVCPGGSVNRCINLRFDGAKLITPMAELIRWAGKIPQ